jgi:hypothetical protein
VLSGTTTRTSCTRRGATPKKGHELHHAGYVSFVCSIARLIVLCVCSTRRVSCQRPLANYSEVPVRGGMTTPRGPIRTLHDNSQDTGDTTAHCYSELVYLGGGGILTFVRDPGFEVPHVATCRRNVGRLPNVCTRRTSSCARQNHRNHSF